MTQSTVSRRRGKSESTAVEPSTIDQVVRIPLTQLVNHPANPDASAEEIAETAGWLKARGQEEPLVVRPIAEPAGSYEVLAGKRRLAAAESLGWTEVDCRIRRDLDKDAEAVAFIAASNAQRHAETPIRQAKMIEAMFWRGYTLKQAGAIYGLQTEPAVRNKLQLLKLPASWQQRIISGEISESAARCLVPYAEHPTLVAAIETAYCKDQKDEWSRESWATREQFEDSVENVVRGHTRPVEKGNGFGFDHHDYGRELGYTHPCYLKLTPDVEKEIEVVELPLGRNGKLIRRAVNTERYDELQVGEIKKRLAKKAGRSTSDDPDDKPKKRTAAEEKALAKKQAEQLSKRIKRWRHEWLREIISRKLRQKVPDHWVFVKLTLWCLGQRWDYHAHGQLRLRELLAGEEDNLLESLVQDNCTWQRALEVLSEAFVIPEKNPDWCVWPHALVEQLARDLQVDLVDEWGVMQGGGQITDRFRAFFEIHNGAQLDALGDELGVYLGGAKGKAAKLKQLFAVERTLKLPASIELLESTGKKRRAK